MLTVILTSVWCLSDGCTIKPKFCSRFLSSILYAAVFITLVFAPREDKFVTIETRTEVYDDSISGRIAVTVVVAFFALFSCIICLKQSNEKIELSTIHHDRITFWQDE